MKITLSVIKADVGSIGGHTKPSERMLEAVRDRLRAASRSQLVIDGLVTHTGDDIAIIMSHRRGVGAVEVHRFAWDSFLAATDEARRAGMYGAGQDLLVNAPSGNVRGAGPAVAEIEFERDPASPERPAEAFLVFAADKCGPGAYNYPLYTVFCDPMHNGGLLLSPKLHKGFTVTIIDMDHKGHDGDRVIRLDVPERIWDVASLLQDADRFAIESIHSRHKPDEQIVSASATRLHNIAGKYTGKDDPVAIVRTQGIFPAPEELVEPYTLGHFVTGDCRGSHVMPIMPVAANTAVAGPYCLPLVSCLAFSMDPGGTFSREYLDIFGNPAWDATRLKVQQKSDEWRRQGFVGPTMASHAELSYTGLVDALAILDLEFVMRREPGQAKREVVTAGTRGAAGPALARRVTREGAE
ncbi:MAG: fructose 1,6-bisphosphatase [Candidatus Rokubacteria bacterium]|nr:fructose 1,6-bisphosphatase [Candidatus Rokubacteria bacterium]MBI3105883.1 fructose 1,6-bisphosphatase [Candidatus Rokubacteria bacterium]